MRLTLQTYTVEFNRDGSPLRGHVVGRLKSSGNRFIANHADDSTLQQLSSNSREPIGRSGKVKKGEKGKNLFTFDAGSKL
jgi:Thiolase-like protein type 1 additional C-terminal domain